MNIIAHRRNTISDLIATSLHYGVEVDIRSCGEQIIIHHDPFVPGENFVDWLAAYQHGTLILNVKEEGLESRLIELMERFTITDFFFLDQSFPFLVKWSLKGERRCAVRVSEYESVATALSLAGKVNWVWVDCFTRFPLSTLDASRLKEAGFRLCAVSPELQGRSPADEIPALQGVLNQRNIQIDAVCTKFPAMWEHFCIR
jgi:hypothetical protein